LLENIPSQGSKEIGKDFESIGIHQLVVSAADVKYKEKYRSSVRN
jgi:hypothetical protein